LELSTQKWIVTAHSPARLSVYKLDAGDIGGLLALLERLRTAASKRLGRPVRVITVYEAGLDGFWLHRRLEAAGIENHVVDAASVAVSRRARRAKTDRIRGGLRPVLRSSARGAWPFGRGRDEEKGNSPGRTKRWTQKKGSDGH
jgi:transposase